MTDCLSCVFCDWITNHATEADIEAQRQELEHYNAVRDDGVGLSPSSSTSRSFPHPPSPSDTSSMHTSSDSYRTSPSTPLLEPLEQGAEDDTSADLIASLRDKLQLANLRSLYWQHQFTQGHAEHAKFWSENKRLESQLLAANEKLDDAEARVGELEAELETLRRNRRRGTTGFVGGPREMEKVARLMDVRPSSR